MEHAIFGGGALGLMAAYRLAKAGQTVMVFEQETVAGGLAAGFRVGPIQMVRHSDWLRSSAKRACQSSHGPYWHRLMTAKPVSRLATWYCHLSHQADCIIVSAER